MGVLRLLLALAVVVSHTGAHAFGYRPISGPDAVQAFYAISGFYMALVLDTKYGTGWKSVRLFWQNRYLRLAPTYWIVLAFVLVHTLWRKRQGELLTTLPGMNAGSIAYVVFANLAIVGQDLTNFIGFTPEAGERGFHFVAQFWGGSTRPGWHFLLVPPAWTIALELTFYALVPLLARLRTPALVAVGVGSVAVRLALYAGGLRFDPWTYRFFPCELVFFVSGMLAYRLYQQHRWSDLSPGLRAALGALFVLFPLAAGNAYVADAYKLALPLMLPAAFAWTRDLRWDNKLGELSYPLYICHWALVRPAEHFGRWAPVVASAAAVGCALLLVRFVERPVDAFRQRRLRRAQAAESAPPVAASAAGS
jgi:peptidoglycan/LPS O-acetylase OafA/YrhL